MYSFNHIITGDYTSCLNDLLWICQYIETTRQQVFIRIFLITMFTLQCLHCRTAVPLPVPPAESVGALGWGAHHGAQMYRGLDAALSGPAASWL